MMELKVGYYVRTKYGIAKYIDDEIKSLKIIVIDRDIAYDHMNDYKNVITQDEIIKSSPKIIKLIQAGDYVNKKEVIQVMYEEEKEIPTVIKCFDDNFIKENEIYSIVTKEQFEQMKYRIGD